MTSTVSTVKENHHSFGVNKSTALIAGATTIAVAQPQLARDLAAYIADSAASVSALTVKTLRENIPSILKYFTPITHGTSNVEFVHSWFGFGPVTQIITGETTTHIPSQFQEHVSMAYSAAANVISPIATTASEAAIATASAASSAAASIASGWVAQTGLSLLGHAITYGDAVTGIATAAAVGAAVYSVFTHFNSKQPA